MNVSFIIPFRTDNGMREYSFDWNVRRLIHYFPDSEIIIQNSSEEVFSRSEARNKAAVKATHDYIVPLDADTVWNPESLDQAIRALEKGSPWVIAYDTYLAMDHDSTNNVLKGTPDLIFNEKAYRYEVVQKDTGAVGGFMVLRKDDLFKLGGWDERFVGWGWEDRAFAHAADKVIGPHARIKGAIYHLWHPCPIEQTIHHPRYQENWSLYNQYVSRFAQTHKAYL